MNTSTNFAFAVGLYIDEFYEQLVRILESHGEEDQGEWIISNPCFEIWLFQF